MSDKFKTAATIKIKAAGVADYNARKAIADWLRAEADMLVSDHKMSLEGYKGRYNYAGPAVLGGETHTVRE